jgi:hypothetical protein
MDCELVHGEDRCRHLLAPGSVELLLELRLPLLALKPLEDHL